MTPWQALHFLGGWRCWNGGAKLGLSYEADRGKLRQDVRRDFVGVEAVAPQVWQNAVW